VVANLKARQCGAIAGVRVKARIAPYFTTPHGADGRVIGQITTASSAVEIIEKYLLPAFAKHAFH
jgi:hypothetical protein